MSCKVGIVGLPNVGKSSLFQVLTKKQVDTSNYPFATIDPNVGVVAVPDKRLEQIAKLEKSPKVTPTTIEFVDIAGLVKGAHQGEGLGNQFLSHVREVDAIAEVIRVFEDKNVTHVGGQIDPTSDAETIGIELAMSDLATVTKRIENLTKQQKAGLSKEQAAELELMQRAQKHLGDGAPLRTLSQTDEDHRILKAFNFLTIKPLLYVLNVGEDQVQKVKAEAYDLPPENTIVIATKVEQEISALPPEESETYLQELGWSESALNRLIHTAYHALHLNTFFTAGPVETRAWTIRRGSTAPQAAGAIHTDFEKHFIRAEVVSYDQLIQAGSWDQAQAAGALRIEGKEYVVQDGDVIYFRTTA